MSRWREQLRAWSRSAWATAQREHIREAYATAYRAVADAIVRDHVGSAAARPSR